MLFSLVVAIFPISPAYLLSLLELRALYFVIEIAMPPSWMVYAYLGQNDIIIGTMI